MVLHGMQMRYLNKWSKPRALGTENLRGLTHDFQDTTHGLEENLYFTKNVWGVIIYDNMRNLLVLNTVHWHDG